MEQLAVNAITRQAAIGSLKFVIRIVPLEIDHHLCSESCPFLFANQAPATCLLFGELVHATEEYLARLPECNQAFDE